MVMIVLGSFLVKRVKKFFELAIHRKDDFITRPQATELLRDVEEYIAYHKMKFEQLQKDHDKEMKIREFSVDDQKSTCKILRHKIEVCKKALSLPKKLVKVKDKEIAELQALVEKFMEKK